MKETTVLNNISRLIENIDYKSVYIEIKTKNDKFILEKDSKRKIGFDTCDEYRKGKNR